MRRLGQFVLLVVGNAGLQTLVAWIDEPAVSWGLAVVSGLILVSAAWLAWWIADPARGLGWRSLAWVAALAVVTAAVAIAFPYAVPVVVAVACAVLAAGGLGRAGALVARHPVRSILLALTTIVVVALLWALSAVSGLLIGGVLNSALVWLAVGAAGALLVVAWVSLSARPRAQRESR